MKSAAPPPPQSSPNPSPGQSAASHAHSSPCHSLLPPTPHLIPPCADDPFSPHGPLLPPLRGFLAFYAYPLPRPYAVSSPFTRTLPAAPTLFLAFDAHPPLRPAPLTRRSAASQDHCMLRSTLRVPLSSHVGTVVTCRRRQGVTRANRQDCVRILLRYSLHPTCMVTLRLPFAQKLSCR